MLPCASLCWSFEIPRGPKVFAPHSLPLYSSIRSRAYVVQNPKWARNVSLRGRGRALRHTTQFEFCLQNRSKNAFKRRRSTQMHCPPDDVFSFWRRFFVEVLHARSCASSEYAPSLSLFGQRQKRIFPPRNSPKSPTPRTAPKILSPHFSESPYKVTSSGTIQK